MYWQNPDHWTETEKDALIRLYPEAPPEEILKVIPGRKWDSIKQYATRRMKLRRLRNQPGDPRRVLSAAAAARLIGMSPTHFKKTHAKQIPHDVAAGGGYLFDPDEVRSWYHQKVVEGKVLDKQQARLSLEEGSARLRKILNQLPMDAPEFAEKLGISLGALRNYMESRYRTPVSVVTDAEVLLTNFKFGMLKSKYTPVDVASKELHRIKDFLGLSKRGLAAALRVPDNTLTTYLYPKTGKVKVVPTIVINRARTLLKTTEPRRHRMQDPTKLEMIEALKKVGGVRGKAAASLGIANPRFNALLHAYEIEHLARERYARDRITKRELVTAMEQSRGNKSEASRLLGITRVTLYRLLQLAGLD